MKSSAFRTLLAAALAVIMAAAPAFAPVASALTEDNVSYYDGTYSTAWYDNDPAPSDKIYHLSSAADLAGYAYLVNTVKGGASFGGYTVQLDCNVVWNTGSAADWYDAPPKYSWTPISISQSHYSSGGFNGNGHYISGLYQKDNGSNHTGFIGVHGGSDLGLKNLAIVNSFFCKTASGGSVNSNYGVGVFMATPYNTFTFENLYTDAIVMDASNYTGGIVGSLRSSGATVNVKNCVFAGKIISGGSNVGGIVSANSGGNVNITNCLNLGSIYGKSNVGGILGGVTYSASGKAVRIGSCVNAGPVNSLDGSTSAGILGYNGASSSLVPVLSNCVVSDAFNTTGYNENAVSGTVSVRTASSLTSSSLDLSSLDTDTLYTSGQFASAWKVRASGYPFPKTVSAMADALGISVSINSNGDYSFEGGPDASGYSSAASVIGISSADDLSAISFANSFLGANFAGQTLKLTENIVFNTGRAADWASAPPAKSWTPIAGFAGTFDGDGHYISGLYCDSASYVGMFASVGGGTVKNLLLLNSYFAASGNSCAGVSSSASGGARFENIYCDAIVKGSLNHVGGIVGSLGGGGATFDGCVFAGSVYAGQRYCAGILGNTNFNRVFMRNCINLGSITAADEMGGILGICGNATGDELTDCINAGYISSFSNSYNADISTWVRHNDNDFSNGGIVGTVKGSAGNAYRVVMDNCWLVSDFSANRVSVKHPDPVIVGEEGIITLAEIFGADLSVLDSRGGTSFAASWTATASYPLPAGVAGMLDAQGMSLSLDADRKPRVYNDLTWQKNYGDSFVLKSASQLESFSAYYGSSTLSGKNVVVDCDIDMSATSSAPASVWTPVGGFSNGVFVGGGHAIKGINAAGSLIKTSTNASFTGLSVVDSTFTGEAPLAGFIGYATGKTVFTDCYTNASVVGTGNNVGGFVGSMKYGTASDPTQGATFTRCWFDGSVTTDNRYVSGFVANNQSQDTSFTDCFFTGTASSVGHTSEPVVAGFAGAIYDGKGSFVNCVSAGTVTVEPNYAGSKGGIFSFRSYNSANTDTYLNNYAVTGGAHFLSNENSTGDGLGHCAWISADGLNGLQGVLGGGWGYRRDGENLRLVPIAFADSKTYELSFYKGDRAPADWTYPSMTGKVFAGWYEDEALTVPCDPSVTEGEAYARFADERVIAPHAQSSLTSNTVRFVSTVDTVDYQAAGFRLTVGDKTVERSLKNVYRTITAGGSTVVPAQVTGTDESVYFTLFKLTGIPDGDLDTPITVSAFWVTLDGTKVYSKTDLTVTYNSLSGSVTRIYSLDTYRDRVKVQGRSATAVEGVAVDWSGSALEFNVECGGNVYVSAIGSYATSLGSGISDFTVYVDGVKTRTVRVNKGVNEDILVAENLAEGVHSLRLTKWAHAESAQITFTSVKCDGALLDRPADKDLYIEFIGDSITCGYGANNGANDGNLSYAYIAAQRMNADWSIVARSGLWLSSATNSIPLIYPYVSWYRDGGSLNGELYDFSRIPDAVVINLGTNDYNGNAGAEKFANSVRSFIADVRSRYGNDVPIVWAYGMMNDGYKDSIISVVNELGGENYYLGFTQNNDGPGSHPSAAALQQYGVELADYLTGLLAN